MQERPITAVLALSSPMVQSQEYCSSASATGFVREDCTGTWAQLGTGRGWSGGRGEDGGLISKLERFVVLLDTPILVCIQRRWGCQA